MGHQRTNQPHQLPIFTQGHVHLLIVAIHALTADEVSWPINECLSMLSFCICNNFSADLLLQGHEVHAKHRVLLPQSPTFLLKVLERVIQLVWRINYFCWAAQSFRMLKC